MTLIYLGDDREIAFALRSRRSGIEAIATRWAPGRAHLMHEVRRYAEPHGIEFEDELLRM